MTKGKPTAPVAPTPTAQSRALVEAIREANKTHEQVGAALGVSPALVSAWATGRKPVAAKHAIPLADFLGTSPGALSADYARIAAQAGTVATLPGNPTVAPELAQSRAENDVDALRFMVSALVSAMLVHRPAEAQAVAKVLRRTTPARFLRHGYLGAQLAILESGLPQPSATEPAAAPPRAKRGSSRRTAA